MVGVHPQSLVVFRKPDSKLNLVCTLPGGPHNVYDKVSSDLEARNNSPCPSGKELTQ